MSLHLKYQLPDGRVGDVRPCRGKNCGEEVVFAENPKTGRKPPYNKDGTPHFATCVDAAEFRGRATARKTDGSDG